MTGWDSHGLAIFSDHTTDYSHGEDVPLSLTLGWGGEGGFWWGKRPLQNVQEMRYAILPHSDRWERAGIQRESRRWTEPLLPVHIRLSSNTAQNMSLLQVTDPSIEISSVQRDGKDLLVRLYNSGSDSSSFTFIVGSESGDVTAAQLDGKHKERLPRTIRPDCGSEVGMSLPCHSLATLRISDIRYNKDESIGCEPGLEYEKRDSVST